MIIRASPRIALLEPPAHVAVLDRFRIRCQAGALADRVSFKEVALRPRRFGSVGGFEHLALHVPEISRVLRYAIPFARESGVWRDNPHRLRVSALCQSEQL